MLVAIAGGHGKIARRLTHLLVAHGDHVRGLIRNPDHAEALRADGAEPVVCDSEHEASPRSLERSPAPTPSSSPPALDRAAGPSANGRSIVTARSSCSRRPAARASTATS